MSIVIDGLDLIRRVQDGILEEIRNISYINIIDRRNIVELDIPGSQGNIIQDMGFDAIKVELFGEVMGQNSRASLESLRDKYESNKPISFSSDITSIAEIINVIIEYLYIEEVAGSPFRYKYYIFLREYIEERS
jgi:hypothetical protein